MVIFNYELSLAKPGGGEASRESALPTSLLAYPSGGWPLNLLEVRIVYFGLQRDDNRVEERVGPPGGRGSLERGIDSKSDPGGRCGRSRKLNFPWRSQGEAKPPGSQRSQPLSLPVPREVGLSISSRSALYIVGCGAMIIASKREYIGPPGGRGSLERGIDSKSDLGGRCGRSRKLNFHTCLYRYLNKQGKY